jgi:hypothetical protein
MQELGIFFKFVGLLSDAKMAASLPILFQTLRGKKISEKKLDELVEMIRKA